MKKISVVLLLAAASAFASYSVICVDECGPIVDINNDELLVIAAVDPSKVEENAWVFKRIGISQAGVPIFSEDGNYDYDFTDYTTNNVINCLSSVHYQNKIAIGCFSIDGWDVLGTYTYNGTPNSFGIEEWHELIGGGWAHDQIFYCVGSLYYRTDTQQYHPIVVYCNDCMVGYNNVAMADCQLYTGTELGQSITWTDQASISSVMDLDPNEYMKLAFANSPLYRWKYCLAWSGTELGYPNDGMMGVTYSSDYDWYTESDVTFSSTVSTDIDIDTYDAQHYGVVYSKPGPWANTWQICYRTSSNYGASWSNEDIITTTSDYNGEFPCVAIHYEDDYVIVLYRSGANGYLSYAENSGEGWITTTTNYDDVQDVAAVPGWQDFNGTFADGDNYVYCLYESQARISGGEPTVTQSVGSQLRGDLFEVVGLFPNPSNGMVSIEIEATQDTPVTIGLFDIAGREVERVNNVYVTAGTNRVSMDLTDLGLGVYLIQVESQGQSIVRRVVLAD